jgi:hypothetical protein
MVIIIIFESFNVKKRFELTLREGMAVLGWGLMGPKQE